MNDYRKILLVEDNPKDVELTLAALEEHNLANRVVVVHDGVEVLEYLRGEGDYSGNIPEKPVVIMLDIKMPRMDGVELLKVLKKDPELRMIPVVMLTSSRESPDLKTCYELGVNAYVVKPVEFDKFMEVIRQLGIFWVLLNEPPF